VIRSFFSGKRLHEEHWGSPWNRTHPYRSRELPTDIANFESEVNLVQKKKVAARMEWRQHTRQLNKLQKTLTQEAKTKGESKSKVDGSSEKSISSAAEKKSGCVGEFARSSGGAGSLTPG